MPLLDAIYNNHGRSGDHIFTLFTGSTEVFAHSELPRSPRTPTRDSRGNLEAPDHRFRHPLDLQWLNPDQPYMALIPRQDPFRGPLFSRLRYTYQYLPIVRLDGPGRPEWQLEPSVQEEWQALELFCRQAVMGLFNLCCGSYLPQRFELWRFPDRWRYTYIWATERSARVAAFYARNAFLPLMGALSLMLLVIRYLDENGKISYYWPKRLEDETGLDHRWISCLEQSILTDFTGFPRLGGVIRVDKMVFSGLLPLFRTVNMPLILYWGEYRQKSDGVTVFTGPYYLNHNGFVPYARDIVNLYSRVGAENLQKLVNITNSRPRALDTLCAPPDVPVPLPEYKDLPRSAPSPAAETVPEFPPVVYGSGQPPGMSMNVFFEKRADRRRRILERETPVDRQSREAKEKHAEGQACPGKAGATVFIWQLVDGHRIRLPAGRKHQEYHWENYSRAQRRYDSINNQWDLCSEFGDNDDEMDSDDDYDDDTYNAYGVPPLEEDPPQGDGELSEKDQRVKGCYSKDEIGAGRNQFSSIDDLQRDIDDHYPAQVTSAENPELASEDYEDAAYYRFGFHEEHPVPAPAKVLMWPIVRKLLGNGHWELPCPPTEEVKTSLCIFFGYLESAEGTRDIPPPIYDLHQSNADLVLVRHKFDIRQVGDSNQHFALVPVVPSKSPLVIVVRRAATVVELLRRLRDPDDFMMLARELLDRCISFHTCIRGPFRARTTPEKPKQPPASLGRRDKGYKPDDIDYKMYVQQRDAFLRSPRGRAALLAGGIVARIAWDVVPYRMVYDGPLEDVYDNGIYFSAGQTGYYDDVLLEEEVSLICGTYSVNTGKNHLFNFKYPNLNLTGRMSGDTEQLSNPSWWPRPGAWESSGLWQGCWTADCEKWYQKRLEKHAAGQLEVWTAKYWRRHLKYDPEPNRIAKKNDTLGAEWLA